MKRELLIHVALSIVIFTGMYYTYLKTVYIFDYEVAIELPSNTTNLKVLKNGFHWLEDINSRVVRYTTGDIVIKFDSNGTRTK